MTIAELYVMLEEYTKLRGEIMVLNSNLGLYTSELNYDTEKINECRYRLKKAKEKLERLGSKTITV